MRWADNLYSKNIRNLKRLKWKLDHKAGVVEVYVICISQGEHTLLEIYPSFTLHQKHIERESLYVVGVARGYIAAVELVQKIMEDVYKQRGDLDVKAYFRKGQCDCASYS